MKVFSFFLKNLSSQLLPAYKIVSVPTSAWPLSWTLLEGLETYLEGLKEGFEGLETCLEGLKEGLEGRETCLQEIETGLEGIETGPEGLETDLGRLETDL